MTLALGLMSGTSCDGASAALVAFRGRRFTLLAFRTVPYPPPVTALLHRAHELTTAGISQLNILLGELLASAARALLRQARVSPSEVAVIGSHGHTVYHGPHEPIPSTLQLGEPAVIAERTGIPVVADFRMRDLAAGGQAAPLVPFFDDHLFGGGPPRALQNLGGIANAALVGRGLTPLAFDTGPGNCLIDAVARRLSRGRRACDAGGRLAARGRIDHAAVRRMWRHPYFRRPPPKSTGRELFNDAFLAEMFGRRWWARGADAAATVTYFTAYSIAESYRRFLPVQPREVIVSGGGVRNQTLMRHLTALLHPVPVRSIERYGLPAQAKEPAAFAFLALRAIRGQMNHLPSTTGASGPRLLGSLTPQKRGQTPSVHPSFLRGLTPF
ncbi:MAG: anhydro-N-acetylmuramic acid kinase [Candidatus Omnitrophica bacterium]|nr:anhydro-N-acetylmuramic acid kinase [Candidatus Omnitrophota bacterium]